MDNLSTIVENSAGKIIQKKQIDSSFCDLWHFNTESGKFFVKHNKAPGNLTLLSEAFGLDFLRNNKLRAPEIIFSSAEVLILPFIESGSGNAHAAGENLAEFHKNYASQFGLPENNFIADLPQINTPCENWPNFYIQMRILPMVEALLASSVIQVAEKHFWDSFVNHLPSLIPANVRPSPLHGDLWSGNIVHGKEFTWFIDPSVYYGDALVDIAMTRLFGGFSEDFYQAYEAVSPLEQNAKMRIELYQIYPLLVHARLFGLSYYRTAKAKAENLLKGTHD